MMELEVEAVTGARFMLRATNRNGYRERGWETRTGRRRIIKSEFSEGTARETYRAESRNPSPHAYASVAPAGRNGPLELAR